MPHLSTASVDCSIQKNHIDQTAELYLDCEKCENQLKQKDDTIQDLECLMDVADGTSSALMVGS